MFPEIKPGTVVKDEKLDYDEEKELEDRKSDSDVVTMEVICDVANSVESMIKMTFDAPSKYPEKKVPMLDVKVWLDKDDNDRVYYEYYEKPTKSKFVISKSSAMPKSAKMESLSQGIFRRLHNTKREIDNNVKINILNKYMAQLKQSGYNEEERYHIIKSGYKGYEKLEQKENEGQRPFYRSHSFQSGVTSELAKRGATQEQVMGNGH